MSKISVTPIPRLVPGLVLAAALALAACEDQDPNAFPPACPRPGILADGADLTRFRPGPGRDLTDMVIDGRITGIKGQCRRGEQPGQLEATVTVTLELSRGPAAAGRTDEVTYYVAAIDNSEAQPRILEKRPLTASVTFPANVDRVAVTSAPLTFGFPVSAKKGGASYALIASFQLAEDQIAFNRKRGVR